MRILIYINGWLSTTYGLVIQRLECATHNPVILVRVQASPPKNIFNYICFLIKENVYLKYNISRDGGIGRHGGESKKSCPPIIGNNYAK